VPESRAAHARRLDPSGQLAVIILLGCLTAGIIEGPRVGWGSAAIAVLFAVAVLAAVALAVIESRRREPLVDMRYFRSVPFSGAALIAVGAVLLAGLTARSPVCYLILAYLVYVAGAGLVSAPVTNTALSGMPHDQVGVAGAIASTCRQTGAAVGVAVTGAIIASRSAGFVPASHAAWAALAGCGIMVVMLGIVSTTRRALATAERNGARIAAGEGV
jgi:hypothetical protein